MLVAGKVGPKLIGTAISKLENNELSEEKAYFCIFHSCIILFIHEDYERDKGKYPILL